MAIYIFPDQGDDLYALRRKVGIYLEFPEHKLPTAEELKVKLLEEVDQIIEQWHTTTEQASR